MAGIRLQLAVHAKIAEDRLHRTPTGVDAEVEVLGDLLHVAALGEEGQDLQLPGSELGSPREPGSP
jgi:hypothetical protein